MADDGLAQVLAAMEHVTLDVDRTMRTALRAGARTIMEAAKAGANRIDDPATAENIAKNITTRNFSKSAEDHMGGVGVQIGVKGGAKEYANTKLNRRKRRVGAAYETGGVSSNPGGDTWYWRFLEFGTRKMSARPFMRPAFDNHQASVLSAIVASLQRAVNRAGRS